MRLPLFVALVPVLAGCTGNSAPATPAASATAATAAAAAPATAAAVAGSELVLDSFEDDRLWTLEAADDHAVLDWRAAEASDGASGLGVAFSATGRGKASVRKEVDLDLSRARWLQLDVFNATASPQVAVAPTVITASGVWASCRSQTLAPGWNRDLRFTLDAAGFAEGVDAARFAAGASKVERLMLSVFPGDQSGGRVVFDRLRVFPGEQAQRRPALRLGALTLAERAAAGAAVAVELTVAAPPAWSQAAGQGCAAWAPGELRAEGPGGTTLVLPLALTGVEAQDGGVQLRLAGRLVPDRAGVWRLRAGAKGGEGWRWSEPRVLVVDPGEPARVHALDGEDPRWFNDPQGRPFRPHGQNLAWMADADPWFAALAANGGNWARVWTCPWHLPLAAGGRGELPDFQAAAGLDRLFASAARRGIAVQLVLMYHGMLGADWGKNPLNKANGGPISDPRQFWSDGAAKAWFRGQLDYAVARWSAEPALFAWELVNECELCPRFDWKDVLAWHREMAAYLRQRDPRRHLVTTSTAGAGDDALWQLGELDFAQPHAYTPDIEGTLARTAALAGRLAKPVFLGELGRGWRAPDDQRDPEGRHLRQSLWLAAVSPMAGSPAPWWWDTVLQPNRLERHFAGPAAYLAGDDRRGWRPLAVSVDLGERGRCVGLAGADRVRAYIFNPQAVQRPDEPQGETLARPAEVAFAGCAPGTWAVRWHDAGSGGVERREEVVVGADARLRLTIPATAIDRALAADRVPRLETGLTLQP